MGCIVTKTTSIILILLFLLFSNFQKNSFILFRTVFRHICFLLEKLIVEILRIALRAELEC